MRRKPMSIITIEKTEMINPMIILACVLLKFVPESFLPADVGTAVTITVWLG